MALAVALTLSLSACKSDAPTASSTATAPPTATAAPIDEAAETTNDIQRTGSLTTPRASAEPGGDSGESTQEEAATAGDGASEEAPAPAQPAQPAQPAAPAPQAPADAAQAGSSQPEPSTGGVDLDTYIEQEGLGQAKAAGQVDVVPSLKEAQSSTSGAEHIVVSDGASHVDFQRGKDEAAGADVTIAVDGTTYGATFTTEVTALAYDFGADAGTGLQEAIDLAASRGLGLRLAAGQNYTLSSGLTLPDALPYLDGNGATLTVTIAGGSASRPADAITLAAKSSGTVVTNLTMNLKDSAFSRGIVGDALTQTTISRVSMVGLTFRGIQLSANGGPLTDIRIENNRLENVEADASHKGTVYSLLVSTALSNAGTPYASSASPIWDQYTAEGTVSPNVHEASRITIAGNSVHGGYYGLGLHGMTSSLVSGNVVSGNVRNISMQNNASGNLVENNYLSNSRSSSVHLAYNSDNNIVRSNTIVSDRASGQGLLQAYQGSEGNTFSNNTIDLKPGSTAAWVLYVGTDSSRTTFTGNTVTGAASKAMVGIESVWDGTSAASGLSSRNAWSYMGAGSVPSPVDGSAQSYNGGNGPLTDVAVENNVFVPNAASVPVVYVGAEVSAGRDGSKKIVGHVTGLRLTGNSVLGSGYSELITTHKGSLSGVGSATIEGDTSVGTATAGASALSGGDGDDSFMIDDAGDSITDTGGTDTAWASVDATLPEGVENLRLVGTSAKGTGNSADNALSGNAADNTLSGGAGNDTLSGGEGSDTLTGGEGADSFVIDARLDGSVDTITDFAAGQDTLVLSTTVFGELTGQWLALKGSETAQTRVIQDGDTLLFDADGSGTAFKPVAFATVSGAGTLTRANIVVR